MPTKPAEYSDELNGESSLLSFVVHIWKEESASEEHQTIWRGHITTVPNGERYYFTNINEISTLIAAYLKV